MKKEYLMLGHIWKPGKVNPAGWFVSEKLDGVRAFWDGGISRGILAKDVPYSNTVKDVNTQIATGLWSRTGKVIHAPNWFTNELPNFPLDGELTLGRGTFQATYSAVSRHIPIEYSWKDIDYKIFDTPSYEIFLRPRTIKVRDYQFQVNYNAYDWYVSRQDGFRKSNPRWVFETTLIALKNRKFENRVVQLIEQITLPFSYSGAIKKIDELMDEVLRKGGEGLILRRPSSYWVTERSHNLLKFKPYLDAEGVVVGYHPGEGKYEGMMGSLIIKAENKKHFKISGFTDSERLDAESLFPIGSRVTYKYRELSVDGVPKEPRYFRKAS